MPRKQVMNWQLPRVNQKCVRRWGVREPFLSRFLYADLEFRAMACFDAGNRCVRDANSCCFEKFYKPHVPLTLNIHPPCLQIRKHPNHLIKLPTAECELFGS
jgi:hypothetical protein